MKNNLKDSISSKRGRNTRKNKKRLKRYRSEQPKETKSLPKAL